MLEESFKATVEEIIPDVDPEIFLVSLHYDQSKNTVLSIRVDTDQGITLDQCAKLSRKIGRWIDENEELQTPIRLEVSSPGLDEPLKLLRQYHKNIGRKLAVKMLNGEEHLGVLEKVTESTVTLTPVKEKGKRKKTVEQLPIDIKFAEIDKAHVKISF